MAQLDQLIGALAKHGAEALVLQDGQKPSLILQGARRPIVNSALTAVQTARLVAEIAPEAQRASLAAGQAVNFTYVSDGVTFAVDAPSTGTVTITMARDDGAPQEEDNEEPAVTEAAVGFSGTPEHLDQLFHAMVEAGASDLHMSSDALPMFRVDGELHPIAGADKLNADQVSALLQEISPAENWEEFQRVNDSDFAYEIAGLCRFRCNLFLDRKGPGGVFRVIPSKILTVDDLGLSGSLRDLCLLNKGLVLVTGPTGSGKSTTLTALVDHINTIRTDHVITIEDPIEFVHEHRKCLINQREVGKHTQGFKSALRAALREDPDIVLVGELRDLETVAIALETAETGHLVFGTLHTSSAISTVDRLIDQFPADQQEQIRVMLAESLKAVIAQVLCRKKGGGRVAALEVLMGIPAVSNLIREAKTFQLASIMQTGRKHGMITMNDALIKLVQDGVVEPREAYMKAMDKHNLLTAFKSKEISTDFLSADETAS